MKSAGGRYFYFLSKNNRIRIVPLEGWRGRIKDRNGKILADSRIAYNVMVVPQDIGNSQELFNFLSKTLEVDQKMFEQRYAKKKFAPFAPVVVAEDIPRDKAIILEESKYLFPSLIFRTEHSATRSTSSCGRTRPHKQTESRSPVDP